MSDFSADTARLDLIKKLLETTNLQADTALKAAQTKFEPWKVVVSALAAGGVVGGALVGGTVALMRWKVGG